MNLGFLTKGFNIPFRKLVASTILISGTLAWFFVLGQIYLSDLFKSMANGSSWAYVGSIFFFGSGAVSAILGSMIEKTISTRKLLMWWITLGVVSTGLLVVFQGIFFTLLSGALLGISLGLGFPFCAAFLADSTIAEERARVSGIVILQAFVMAFIAVGFISILNIGLTAVILVSMLLRSTSYIGLLLDDCQEKTEKARTWSSIITYKEFASYLFPWVLFNVAAGITWWMIPSSPEYDSFIAIGRSLRFVCVAVFGFGAGFAADYFGRKQPIVIGLVMLGVGFALLGLAPSPPTVLIYLIISGIAWGSFLTVYLAVPGDLAFSGSKKKFYALGTVVPLIIQMSLSTVNWVKLPANLLSPVLSIILFLSTIPILRASETLSERKMTDRRMKNYVEKVGKIVKESKKQR